MKLLKLFSTYTTISIITAGIPFLLMPVLTNYLSPEDYGKLTLFNTYVTIIIPLISLGATGLISIEYFDKNKDKFQNIFSSIIKIPIIVTIFYLIIFFLFDKPLGDLLEVESEWLILIPIIGLFTILGELLYNMLIINKKAFLYGSITIVKTILEVSLSLIFIILIGMNWKGRVLSWLLISFLISIFSLVYFKKNKWLNYRFFDKKIAKTSILFGLPLIPHIISKFIINQSDAIFIAKMISVEQVGIYRIGYQFGLIISIVSGAFLSVYSPFLLERLADITEKKKKEIVKLSLIFILSLTVLTIIISLSSDFIFKYFIHQDFKNGSQFVLWTALSYLFWGGYLIFVNYIFYLKKTKILAYIAVLNVVLNLVLNYFLIQVYGVIGVSYATTISFFVTFIVVAYISNRLYPMPWFYFFKNKKITTDHK